MKKVQAYKRGVVNVSHYQPDNIFFRKQQSQTQGRALQAPIAKRGL